MKPGEHKDMAIPFGKYGPKDGKPGTLIADLPKDYLEYLLEQDWFIRKFPEHAKQSQIELNYRKKFDL